MRPNAHAFSYIRFSTPEQAKGDSLRRQTEATEQWCRKHGVTLDTSLSLRDLGVSAYSGKHRSDKAALGTFLEAVQNGRVPKGSYLVIENLDRLSREEERTALRLWLDILDHGVNIVQLSPETVFRHERSDMTDIIRAIIELSRGHSESRLKSERVGKAWAEKRKRAREAGEVLTKRLPAWVRLARGGRPELVPDRAAAVRRVYELSAAGLGNAAIVAKLAADGVKPFGDSGEWSRSYIGLLLRDRRAVGEFQPRRWDGKADGPPIMDYFPRVVTDNEFYAVRAAAGRRTNRPRGFPGRVARDELNVFAGLIREALTGGTMFAATRTDGGRRHRVLIPTAASEGKGRCVSFPYVTFERAVLSALLELDPAEVLPPESDPAEATVMEGELAWVRQRVGELKAELLRGGDVAAVADVLRGLERREDDLVKMLEDARTRAARPIGKDWAETRSTVCGVLGAVAACPDPEAARYRLRAALRRLVAEIRLLIVPRGRYRLAEAQFWFTGGGHRSFFIIHRAAKSNGKVRVESAWACRTDKHPDDSFQFNIEDLRDTEQAGLVAEFYRKYPIAVIEKVLANPLPFRPSNQVS